MNASDIIEQLQLEPLRDEGGFFRRVFTHPIRVDAPALPNGFEWSRELTTGIYYLITEDSFSALHRLQATETFHYHAGDALDMLLLQEDGPCRWAHIGIDITSDQEPFVVVPGGTWQGTRLSANAVHGWTLLSVIVSPGFDWEDFQLGDRKVLSNRFPDWANEIAALTR